MKPHVLAVLLVLICALPARAQSGAAPSGTPPSGTVESSQSGMSSTASPQAIGIAPTTTVDTNAPTSKLLADLKARDQELGTEVKANSFGAIYVPALAAKDIALELQRRATGAQKTTLEAPLKKLVIAAYEIDNYGDLGDAQKITAAYKDFTAAVTAVTTIVTSKP